MKNYFTYLIIIFSVFGCKSQNNQKTLQINKDIELSRAYKKFVNNRHDYASVEGEARDTILNRFKKGLIETLSNKKYALFPFDSLSKEIQVVKSKDEKLRIFSWDELNGGTWHIYNSIYQYNTKEKSYSGLLSLKSDITNGGVNHTDIAHYEINEIEDNQYLVKGYGTHGSGKDFYVYRLLSFKNEKIEDCIGCFNGEDRFVYEKSRGHDLKPTYDVASKTIHYPELEPHTLDGEETGFMKPSGKILKLKYKNGKFISTQ